MCSLALSIRGQSTISDLELRGACGMGLGCEEERVAPGPGVATLVREAQGFLGVIERAEGTIGLPSEKSRATAEDEGIRVDKPHAARSG